MLDLEELSRLASAATPGPWHVDQDPRPGMEWNRSIACDPDGDSWVCIMCHSGGKDDARDEATAAYIASCSPDRILKLVEIARAATSAKLLLERCGPHLQGVERECCGSPNWSGHPEDEPQCCGHAMDLSDHIANELHALRAALEGLSRTT